MISFSRFLQEGRDAPLYHGTDAYSAMKIVNSDTLIGTTKQRLHFTKPPDNRERNRNDWKYVYGSSLSRNKKVSASFGKLGCLFTIDQRKLAQKYRIVPVNFFAAGIKQYTHPARLLQDRNLVLNEYEEFVIGNVKNFLDYVISIEISQDNLDKLEDYLIRKPEYHEAFEKFKSNPKLVIQ